MGIALGMGALLFIALSMVNYQIGVFIIRLQQFSWPAVEHSATLLALVFSAAVMLIGFWYYSRPERAKMLRGLIGTVLGSCGVFYIVWSAALLSMDGVVKIDASMPEVHLLLIGALFAAAGILTIAMGSNHAATTAANGQRP